MPREVRRRRKEGDEPEAAERDGGYPRRRGRACGWKIESSRPERDANHFNKGRGGHNNNKNHSVQHGHTTK